MDNAISALVRPPGASFPKALSQKAGNSRIDLPLALEQHRRYVQALKQAGAKVVVLDPLDNFPDSVFVEDTAIILEDKALLCAMKEETRRGEVEHIREEIQKYRTLEILQPPAYVDGGDVILAGDTLYVGQSKRTHHEAAEALSTCTNKKVVPVHVHKRLHLKTSATCLGRNILIIDTESVDPVPFKNFQKIEVGREENYAANCLALGETVLMPEGYPALAKRVEQEGFNVLPIPMSEFKKAEGGLTCLSLLIPHR